MATVLLLASRSSRATAWTEQKLARSAFRLALGVAAVGFAAALLFPIVGYGACWILHEFSGRDQLLTLTASGLAALRP